MQSERPFKLGVLVNPYAGIGGALALKGSDGPAIRQQALSMGAKQQAQDKSRLALLELNELKEQIHIYTASGDMGESLAVDMGFAHSVMYVPEHAQTEGLDSELAAQALVDSDVDFILFAGGDGTARNICQVVGMSIPVLGVPAGCKIHSGVYAITPQAAGRVVKQVIQGQLVNVHEAQVMDIDEQLFRQGKVKAKPYGDMLVPSELQYVQAVKMGGKESDELVLDDIAAYIIETMQEYPEHIFVMGSGSTVAHIMQSLGLENTLLGVDLVQNEDLLASDVTSEQLLAYTLEQPTKLIITLIGGQGHILGRGNQQLSPEFIRRVGKQNILLVATKAKLSSLASRPLIVDSGDLALNQELSGLITVHTGYRDQVLYQVTG